MENVDPLIELNQTVLTDHAQIFSALVQASRAVDSLTPTDPDPHRLDQVLTQLEALDEDIRRHFASEEARGLSARLMETLPDASNEISRLSSEHAEMVALLGRIRGRVRQCSPLAVQELADDLALLLELLYAHEASEDRLLAAAVETEAGHVGGRL